MLAFARPALGCQRPLDRTRGGRSQTLRERPTSCSATAPALKEWAPIIEALGHGDQTVLLRKGGIREPTFTPRAGTFLLFPTSFHTEQTLLKPAAQEKYREACGFDPKAQPQLQFPWAAQLTGAWATDDAGALLSALDPLHIYSPDFLEGRMRWRPTQPVTVLELRVLRCVPAFSTRLEPASRRRPLCPCTAHAHCLPPKIFCRLTEPVIVDPQEEFWGCFSWVDVPVPAPLDALAAEAVAVLAADAFVAKQRLCRERLAGVEGLRKVHVDT